MRIQSRTIRLLVRLSLITVILTWSVGALGQQMSNTVTELKRMTAGDLVKMYPQISADNTKLVYMARKPSDRNYNLYVLYLDSEGRTSTLMEETTSAENPRWVGEKGEQLVFDSNRIEDTWLMWLKDMEGAGRMLQISQGGSYDFMPDITLDGKLAVFCSVTQDKMKTPKDPLDRYKQYRKTEILPTIYVRELGSTKQEQVGRGLTPAWDPAGERIAYSSNITGNYELYIMDQAGKNVQQITNFDGPDIEPAWSPDGRFLAFSRQHNKVWNIWMVEIATGKLTPLTLNEEVDSGPAWAPDGSIYFHSEREGNWDIWRLIPAGYAVTPVVPPVLDTDGDGYMDDVDMCVSDAEDFDGFEDRDGCPDLDNDGDGIADKNDACPGNPETKNGYKDQDGCPDDSPIKKKMVLFGVMFQSAKAVLAPGSIPYLDAFCDLLKEDAGARIEIRGYTDSQGKDARNLELSHKRAEAVMQYLILKGIAEDRLTPVGYGEADPIGDNRTPEGRAMNRRIEAHRID